MWVMQRTSVCTCDVPCSMQEMHERWDEFRSVASSSEDGDPSPVESEPSSSNDLVEVPEEPMTAADHGSPVMPEEPLTADHGSHVMPEEPLSADHGSHGMPEEPLTADHGSHVMPEEPLSADHGSHVMLEEPVTTADHGSRFMPEEPVTTGLEIPPIVDIQLSAGSAWEDAQPPFSDTASPGPSSATTLPATGGNHADDGDDEVMFLSETRLEDLSTEELQQRLATTSSRLKTAR